MKRTIVSAGLCLLILVRPGLAEDPIQIGATFPLTGPLALYGTALKNGALLAEKEINEGSGAPASRLQLVFADNQGDPKLAVSDAKRFIEINRLPALMNAFDFLTLPVLPITERQKIVMVSATIMKFTEKTRPRHAFRTYWDAQGVGQQIGSAAKTRKLDKVAVIAVEDASFVYFREGFTAGLGRAFAIEARFAANQNDFAPLLLHIRSIRPQAILVYAFAGDVAIILKQMAALGMDKVPVFITEGAEDIVERGNRDILQKTKAISYLGSRPGERYKNFIESYKKVYSDMPRLDALLTYESTKLLYAALCACAAKDSMCITDRVAAEFDSNHNRVYEVPLIAYDHGWRTISE